MNFECCWVPVPSADDDQHHNSDGEPCGKRLKVIMPFAEDAVTKRQQAWLSAAGSSSAAWRPRQQHRLAAKHWQMQLDNHIRQCTAFNGLFAFWPGQYSNWREWKGAGLSIDLGSDGVCGYQSNVYEKGLFMWLHPDESHAIKCSFAEMLNEIKCYNLMLLMLITYNVEHGPKASETRRQELRSKLSSVYSSRLPENTPLFMVEPSGCNTQLRIYCVCHPDNQKNFGFIASAIRINKKTWVVLRLPSG